MNKLNVYSILRERILALQYPPNHVLKAAKLSEEFSVSTTPIREAFIRLEMDGLIQQTTNNSPIVTVPLFRTIREALIVRYHLVPLASALVVEFITEENIVALEQILEKARSAANLGEAMQLDDEFHNLLNKATHNDVLVSTLANLRTEMRRLWLHERDGAGYAEKRISDYERCIAALRTQDADAVTRVLQEHLIRFVRQLNASLLDGLSLNRNVQASLELPLKGISTDLDMQRRVPFEDEGDNATYTASGGKKR